MPPQERLPENEGRELENYQSFLKDYRDYSHMPEPQRVLYAGLLEETIEISSALHDPDEADKAHMTDRLGDLLYYFSEIGLSNSLTVVETRTTPPTTRNGVKDLSLEDLDSTQMLEVAAAQVLLSMEEGAADTFAEFGQPETMAGCLSQLYKAIMRVADEQGITLADIIRANTRKLSTRTRKNGLIAVIESSLDD